MGGLSGSERLCPRIIGCLEAPDAPGGTPNWKMPGILEGSASTASAAIAPTLRQWEGSKSEGRVGSHHLSFKDTGGSR